MSNTWDYMARKRHSRGRIEKGRMAAAFGLLLGIAPAAQAQTNAPANPAPDSTTVIDTTAVGDALVVVDAPTPVFEAFAGETWKDALGRWAKDSGYTLVWRAPSAVRIDAPVTMPVGTSFRDAVANVLRPLWHTHAAVVGSFYINRVLVIDARGS